MGTLNSNDVASMILGLHYRIEAQNGFGLMTIKGLKIPRTKFDPLGCLWGAEKKRIHERFGVMSAGTFIYNEGLVSCGFYMSYADCEDNKSAIAERMGIFDASFEQQMMLFKDVLELWLQDEEYGYIPFLAYISKEGEPEIPVLKNMMDAFLTKVGLVIEDERKKTNKRTRRKS